MKLFISALLVLGIATGCATHKTKPAAPVALGLQPIVTPDNSLMAKVVSYNAAGRFVILSFPVGQMPKMDQTFFLYRNGLKVSEIKITGPQSDNNIVADIISGGAQIGDDVRDQ